MTDNSAWDSDVTGATYSRVAPGLNAVFSFCWQDLDIQWHVGADNIWRQYEHGKLTAVTTPEPGLPVALLGELAGIEIGADDVVSMISDSEWCEIEVSVNDDLVVVVKRQPDGRFVWSATLS